jgi:hypothetical protein
MAGRFEEERKYDVLKVQLWQFVDRFTGNRYFGAGDARALVSMAADIAVVEQGYDYVSAPAEALSFARTAAGLAEEVRRVHRRWLDARHELKKLLELKKLRTGVGAPGAAPGAR